MKGHYNYLLSKTDSKKCESMLPLGSACIQELVASAQFQKHELVFEVHNSFLCVVRYDPSTLITTFMNHELEIIGKWEGPTQVDYIECTCYDDHKQPEEDESHRYLF